MIMLGHVTAVKNGFYAHFRCRLHAALCWDICEELLLDCIIWLCFLASQDCYRYCHTVHSTCTLFIFYFTCVCVAVFLRVERWYMLPTSANDLRTCLLNFVLLENWWSFPVKWKHLQLERSCQNWFVLYCKLLDSFMFYTFQDACYKGIYI